MKNYRFAAVLLAALFAVVAFAACNDDDDASGTPVADGNYQLTFALYDGGGNPIAAVFDLSIVTTVDGLFTTTIGPIGSTELGDGALAAGEVGVYRPHRREPVRIGCRSTGSASAYGQ